MIQEFVGQFTYVGIFLVLLVASLGVPIPEEIPFIAAAVLSHEELVRWWIALRLKQGGAAVNSSALFAHK